MTATSEALPTVRPAVAAIIDEMVALRRDLHEHAELSHEERRTQQIVLDRLAALGLEDVRPVAGTGATALVQGAAPGPNLLWRADIDGLPLREETGLPFASTNGAMHACGHDGHTAIALAIARVLAGQRSRLRGSVRFAFQPAEERAAGARQMVEEGILREPPVDQAYGLHIINAYPVGQVRVQAGPVFAAATHFRIVIRGRGGHASAPQGTVDPIVTAAHAVVALQTVVSRSVDPAQTAVLTVGRIEGGVRGNVIPDEVKLSGSIRTYEPATLQRVLKRVEEILAGVCASFGAQWQFDHTTLPAVVNDESCARIVREAVTGFLGEEQVGDERLTGSDDMAYFLEAVPGAYFVLGGGSEEIRYPHHHPKFDFDERCLPIGVEVGLRVIEATTGSDLGA